MAESETILVYENYVGALVVNDCPTCEQSHFLVEGDANNFTPAESGGEYTCGDEVIHVSIIP